MKRHSSWSDLKACTNLVASSLLSLDVPLAGCLGITSLLGEGADNLSLDLMIF